MPTKKILISQPKPVSKSPYFDLEKRYGVDIDFEKFIQIEPVHSRELRKQRLNIGKYTAIVLTSRIAVDHFFRVAEELRYQVPTTLKYFCMYENIAQYLSKYIVYRKRKIFYANGTVDDLVETASNYTDEEFLLPVADNHRNTLYNKLRRKKLKVTKAVFYQIVSSDLSHLSLDYDTIVLFSPAGVKSLLENFPQIKEKTDVKLAAFGNETIRAVQREGLKVHIKAPTQKFPSMTMALENYLRNAKN
jgi:uroporphyrinogen-III synthase